MFVLRGAQSKLKKNLLKEVRMSHIKGELSTLYSGFEGITYEAWRSVVVEVRELKLNHIRNRF